VRNQRNSRIEVLRILTMFFIILSHSCSIGILNQFSFEQQVRFTSVYAFASVASIAGGIGNCIFMIITGYYLSDKVQVSWDKNITLLIKLTIYYWVLLILYYILGEHSIDKVTLIKMIFPFYFGYSWYVTAYVIFCTFIPILNKMIESLDIKMLSRLILLLFIFGLLLPTFSMSTFMYSSMYLLLISYLSGAYIKRNIDNISTVKMRNIALLSIMGLIFSVLCFCFMGKITSKPIWFTKSGFLGRALGSIFALSIFAYLVKQKSFNVPSINKVGSSMLGVYILHDNPVVASWYWKVNFPFYLEGYEHWILFNLIKVIALFGVLLILELFVNRFFEGFFRYCSNKIYRILGSLTDG